MARGNLSLLCAISHKLVSARFAVTRFVAVYLYDDDAMQELPVHCYVIESLCLVIASYIIYQILPDRKLPRFVPKT